MLTRVPPPFAVSAGGNSVSGSGTVVFSNSNGVSFGVNGSTVTASHNGLTTARASTDAIGLNTAQSNVTWTVNSSGLSLDARGYAGTGTSATNATVTLNSNGLAISVAAPGGGGNFSAGVSTGGNTAGNTGISGTRLVFVGSPNITLSQNTDANGATITFSGGAGAAGNTGFISAGGATASLGTVVFSNSNGVSFGVNGQTVTAAVSSMTVSDAATSGTLVRLAFTNLNGVTLSLSTGAGGSHTIVGSHNALTSQSNQNVTAANGGFAFQTLSFSNAQGVSFATSAGSAIVGSVAAGATATGNLGAIQVSDTTYTSGTVTFRNANGISFGSSGAGGVSASYTVPTVTNSSMSVSDAATSGTLARLAFTNLNGVTLSLSTGAGGSHTIVGSHNALTSQSNQALSGSNGSFTFQTATFGNLNGLSFYTSNGSMVGSYTVPAAGAFSAGVSTGGNTSGDTGVTGTRLVFVGSNNITLSQGTDANGATITVSGATVAGQPVNFSAGTTSGNLGSVVFSNSNLVSFGLNGSTITGSVPGTSSLSATGVFSISTNGATISLGVGPVSAYAVGNTTQSTSGTPSLASLSFRASGPVSVGVSNGSIVISGNPAQTRSGYFPAADLPLAQAVVGQASLLFDPESFPNVQFDRILIPISNTNATNSSGSHTVSMWVGLYTQNVSTLSLLGSTSVSMAATHSGTVGSYSLFSGLRHVSVGSTTTLTEGRYWMGYLSRTTSGGANGTYSNVVVSNLSDAFFGFFGSSVNATRQFNLGQGYYSATTSGMPASVAFSEINGSTPNAGRFQALLFASSTV